MNGFTKEPIFHSHISDSLDENHPLAFVSIGCDALCGKQLHAFNNECMSSWWETEFGNFCIFCFSPISAMENLEECLSMNANRRMLKK